VKRDSGIDYVARIFTFTGISIPIFVTGLVVIYLLVRLFDWFPPLGYASLWEDPLINLQQMIFPILVLAFFELNFTARVTRSAMLEVLREDYITTARSKGLGERKVILVHALKNAFLPIITVSGWSLARLLGGTIIIEKIFLVPGMGTLLLDAITARDYTLIQAIVLVYAIAVLTANLCVDLLYAWLDPRIRYA
jgi:peptide/nickel transport system permease protein